MYHDSRASGDPSKLKTKACVVNGIIVEGSNIEKNTVLESTLQRMYYKSKKNGHFELQMFE